MVYNTMNKKVTTLGEKKKSSAKLDCNDYLFLQKAVHKVNCVQVKNLSILLWNKTQSSFQ